MAWPAVCTTLHPWPTAWHRAISSGLSHSRARAWQARIAAYCKLVYKPHGAVLTIDEKVTKHHQ